ncbi:MAG: cell division protein ZapA [Gammaproteobacteria bacterium]|nr:cell division protein ZapA [Gammaproteobacteria bacterium]
MSSEPQALKVHILDKEYLVACPEEEMDALKASAKHLNDKMTEIRETGKVVGIDRIAVMAGLNIAHEALSGGGKSSRTGTRIKKLNSQIDKVLAKYRQAQTH